MGEKYFCVANYSGEEFTEDKIIIVLKVIVIIIMCMLQNLQQASSR